MILFQDNKLKYSLSLLDDNKYGYQFVLTYSSYDDNSYYAGHELVNLWFFDTENFYKRFGKETCSKLHQLCQKLLKLQTFQ